MTCGKCKKDSKQLSGNKELNLWLCLTCERNYLKSILTQPIYYARRRNTRTVK